MSIPNEPRPLPARIRDIATQAEHALTENYSRSTPARTLVASIPVVGSPIDAFLGTRGQNIASRRFEGTVMALSDECGRLDEEKIDRDYLESEAFFDLIWRLFEKGQRTRDQERVRAYAQTVRVSIEDPSFREDAEGSLDLLSELTPAEFRLAAELYRIFGVHPFDWRGLQFIFDECDGPGSEDPEGETRVFQPLLMSRLEAKGLLAREVDVSSEALASNLTRMLDGSSASSPMLNRSFRLTRFYAQLMARLVGDDPVERDGPLVGSIW